MTVDTGSWDTEHTIVPSLLIERAMLRRSCLFKLISDPKCPTYPALNVHYIYSFFSVQGSGTGPVRLYTLTPPTHVSLTVNLRKASISSVSIGSSSTIQSA